MVSSSELLLFLFIFIDVHIHEQLYMYVWIYTASYFTSQSATAELLLTAFWITNDALLRHAVSCHIVITVISVVKLIHASVCAFCLPFNQRVALPPSRTLSFVVTETLLGAPGWVLGLIFSLILDCCLYNVVFPHHTRLWPTTASPIFMGILVRAECCIMWKLGKVAKILWMLVFFFLMPSHFSWEHTYQEVFPVLCSPFIILLVDG